MRKWGIVITVVYALIVLGLLVPAGAFFAGGWNSVRAAGKVYREGIVWIPIASVLAGQALLLFLSVDTSRRRLKPRAHIAISGAVASCLIGLLTYAAIVSLGFAIRGDKFGDTFMDTQGEIIGFWALAWLVWGIVFYLYFRNSSVVVTQITSWLLKGSVLELLIAVPCHIIVRRRQDCSAPVVTSFGIVTGIAIMLLSFGPSVLFLYKKRLDEYETRGSA